METKPKATEESYNAGCVAMSKAAQRWKWRHRNAVLKFNPLGYPPNAVVIANLDEDMIAKTGANEHTRHLLRTMDAAAGLHGTVLQAEMVIEEVFGIERALTVIPGTPPITEPYRRGNN